MSPVASSTTYGELLEAQGAFNPPNGLFSISNGLVGLGIDGPRPGIDEASGWQTLWLANVFNKDGVRSLQRFTNPLCLAAELDFGPDATVALDTRTGVYSAQSGDFLYEVVLEPRAAAFCERLTFDSKAQVRAGEPLEFWETPSQLGEGVRSHRHRTVLTLVDGVQERWHGFSDQASPERFEAIARRSQDWASGPRAPRILIEGPRDDQLFVNSALFHVRSGVNPQGPTGPFGLTNAKYGGRQFWDADTWVFPALALLDPDRAAAIPKFRLATRRSAEAAAYRWAQEARQQFHPSVTPYKFPWEADSEGRENAPGESRKQEHVTADVAACLRTAGALGLIDAEQARETVQGCAQYLWHRATRQEDGTWGVMDTMSPDEFHTGDNDLYTNIAFEQVLRAAYPDRWKSWKFKRPKDETTYLTYDGDQLRGYKQAAALLAVWPLQDPGCESQAGQMLERFAGKSTKSGPAMSRSVESLVRARFGDKESAYEDWRASWQTYTKRPLMMFSESPNGRNTYFLTGAAGCLNAVLYGFVGLRIDAFDPGQKPWKAKLNGGFWLSCDPRLPKAWKSVTLDNVSVLGRRYRLVASRSGVVVTSKAE